MQVILTVGISACGKSTYAGLLKHMEINRDDIRFGVFGLFDDLNKGGICT
jgi:hypothetical protein